MSPIPSRRPPIRHSLRGLPAALAYVAASGAAEARGPDRSVWLGDRPAPVFEPAGRPRGLVVAIHGMSPLAEADPRWVVACRALCAAGLRVVSPRFPAIAALRIQPEQSDEIATALLEAVDHPALACGRRVSAFSVSFSGGLTVAASARPAVRARVSAVLAVGGYARLETALPHLFSAETADPYARLIILGNLFEPSEPVPEPERARLRGCLLDAARANFERRPSALRAALGDSPAAREAAALAQGEPGPVRGYLRRLRTQHGPTLAALDPVAALAGIEAEISLLHGIDDPVIPAEQSVGLAQAVRAEGGRARLERSPLLRHGDVALGPAALIRHGAPLLRLLAGHFAAARAIDRP
jgi:hypothetical protein